MPLRLLQRSQFHHPQYPIAKLRYFSDATEDEVFELERIRTVHQFREGQRVPFSQNGHEGFYYLHEGYTKVTCRRTLETETVRLAGPNDLLGFARWLGVPGNYGLTTLSNVTASFFRKEDFLQLQNRSAYLANQVIQWLMQVLIAQEDRIHALKSSTARARVAGTLDGLSRRFGHAIGGSDPKVAAPIDRKTLADLSGVANEVFSRVLADLEKEEIVARVGRVIVIKNPEELAKLATM